MLKLFVYLACACLLMAGCSEGTSLHRFSQQAGIKPGDKAVVDDFQFNGFTEYWQNLYRHRISYGNLFRMSIADMESTILKAKIDLAEDLGIPGLQMQEGFLSGLFGKPYHLLENPGVADIEKALKAHTALFIVVESGTEAGKQLSEKYMPENIADRLASYQSQDDDFSTVDAFILGSGDSKLYVVAAKRKAQLDDFKTLVTNAEKILHDYELKRGWFGAQTLIKSVTTTPGTPIELIGQGMNEGNSWFVFDGYMEFLAKDEIEGWVDEVGIPVVTDVGFSPIYGCEDYEGLQVQSLFTPEAWIQYAREKKGYVFRPVYDPDVDHLEYDGYIAQEGNMEQINRDDIPFVAATGSLIGGATTSMVVFHKKNEPFTKAALWDAIMAKREVAILEEGKMMGPALYRNALQLLLLDRFYLEEYFGDRIGLHAYTKGNKAHIIIANNATDKVEGKLTLKLPKQFSLMGDSTVSVSLAAGSTKELDFDIGILPEAMGRANALLFQFDGGSISKSTVASLELPPAISVHELLYGSSSGLAYPVTIHNFTKQDSFLVKLTAINANDTGKVVFETQKMLAVPTSNYKTLKFDLHLPAGHYIINVNALGVNKSTQLGVEEATATAAIKEVDLNNDGISEYSMENDQVKITLLTTGARVIEYIVKSKKDNVLFKLWPEKPHDDRNTFRKRKFYPYGGFEDFLGQPSIETHKDYDASITKQEGEYVQVKMKASYYGNTIEKIFTLYGNSPLLEIRFALTMKNPELSMLGPQPILEIGEAHGPEDKFIIPTMDGLQEYVMKPERYYGRAFFINEGWNAGYDTREDISFVGAFPVRQPIFLHMWMNHPSNSGSRYYYAEFQPWVPLFQKTTTYFSYYMWGAGGSWEQGVKALRDRNLITGR